MIPWVGAEVTDRVGDVYTVIRVFPRTKQLRIKWHSYATEQTWNYDQFLETDVGERLTKRGLVSRYFGIVFEGKEKTKVRGNQ